MTGGRVQEGGGEVFRMRQARDWRVGVFGYDVTWLRACSIRRTDFHRCECGVSAGKCFSRGGPRKPIVRRRLSFYG